jgi:hypothetical protein
MFNVFSTKRALSAAALVAFLAMPSLASAHGSMVKISDDATGKTYQVQYCQVLVYANGYVSLGAAGYPVTVSHGTIVYQDGSFNAYYHYQAIPIDRNNSAYKTNGNGSSLGVGCNGSPGNGLVYQPPAPPAILISPGTAPHLIGQDGAGLIGQDGAGVISNDGGSLIIKDGSYHVMADGHPGVTGSHNPGKFACTFVYWPGPPSHYYYDHFTVAPRTGVYLCTSAAIGTLHLTNGGTWRG